MIRCQSIFVEHLDPCEQPASHPVRVLSPVITTAYLSDDCKHQHAKGE